MEKQHALDFQLCDWLEWTACHELPNYVAKQIFEWIFKHNNTDPSSFTNLPKNTRSLLEKEFAWQSLRIDSHLVSKDESEKLLLQTKDNLLIECVLMPYENRTTLCISSQVGCKMGCTFCQTGRMGLKRNLTSGEILEQITIANQCLSKTKSQRQVTHIVFMGMGEPLDNFNEVLKACQTMLDPKGFGLSPNHVTVSTSGLVPEINRLGSLLPVRLAISLHNADDAKRSKMMPINRKYDLQTLKEALLQYPAPSKHGITFEYVMIHGENDTIQDAKKLVKFLHGLKAKVNLIPINHFPGIEMKPSESLQLKTFQSYLSERSIPAPIRYSRGQDISGGCGQLAAKRESEIQMDPRILHRQRRKSKTIVN